MPEFPDWTEFCSNESEHRGLDPLGLEAIGASIVQHHLLPWYHQCDTSCTLLLLLLLGVLEILEGSI